MRLERRERKVKSERGRMRERERERREKREKEIKKEKERKQERRKERKTREGLSENNSQYIDFVKKTRSELKVRSSVKGKSP